VKPPPAAVQTTGHGPDVLFIHGTGGDKSSWSVPIALLQGRARTTTYDRRGAGQWPIHSDGPAPLVSDHAEDAADIILGLDGRPVHVCAVSFGAVIAIELFKRRPELVRGAVLFEPALSGDDRRSSVPSDLMTEFERLIGAGMPQRAGELFTRRSLGEAAWHKLSPQARSDAASKWRQVRYDLQANAAYRVGYEDLDCVDVPVLLLRGGRSRPVFESAVRALVTALPRARCGRIPRAEHLPCGEAWREFVDALAQFVGI
jgi:3-oxoadipate enol-lactonase